MTLISLGFAFSPTKKKKNCLRQGIIKDLTACVKWEKENKWNNNEHKLIF